jgi:rod shape determining protein RodA
MTSLSSDIGRHELSLTDKLRGIQWGLVVLITLIAGIGFAMLYSAANGSLEPWASRQMTRYALALVAMIAIALIDVRYWFRGAYWIYATTLALVVAVELRGVTGMGAQRWISLGTMQLQPSEIMKVGLVLALARYFHSLPPDNTGRLRHLIAPALIIGIPFALVLKQPDLGTAMMLAASGTIMLFLGGVRFWVFAAGAGAALVSAPFAWSLLRDYQKNRLYTFLDPERDPLGAGYHVLQSKIALGSGGLFGKGFLQGTQGHLSFVPEKQTDFIFTILAEEFGLVGGLVLIGLFMLVVAYGFAIALRSRSQFGRLLGLGIAVNFFLHAFINSAMAMGLIPVVGVPLPLISYGGTAMATLMMGFGLLMNVGIHRDVRISRVGESRLD